MNEIIVAGTIEREAGLLDYMKRVYDTNGVAPTILTSQGGGKIVKILVSDMQ